MLRIDPNKWSPQGVKSLEPVAEEVVCSNSNMLVVAGPGAGKTELLAQRACFLLQTGLCPPPYRILAISFKRDAAKNLADRVILRCGEHASRFDSFTLDAFGKSLVDRFRLAIPKGWVPQEGYEVDTSYMRHREMRHWFQSISVPTPLTAPNFQSFNDDRIKKVFELCTFGHKLPYNNPQIDSLIVHYGMRWWREVLARNPGTPSLSFPMLNRLAAFLLRENSKLLTALRQTYHFVFMDEFQDTTPSQYDIVQTAFQHSESVITSVGDSKQKIMGWAGAMDNAFEVFLNDFAADRKTLVRNYRSTPELIQIQDVIAKAIEPKSLPIESVKPKSNSSGCQILEFKTPKQESAYLAQLIANGIKNGKQPRDFCVLARQKISGIIIDLQTALASKNIRIRDESALQDLLKEPAVELALALLRLATRKRDPEAWEFLVNELDRLYGFDFSNDNKHSGVEINQLLAWTKERISKQKLSLCELPTEIIQKIGATNLCSAYSQYRNRKFLDDTLKKLGACLAETNTSEIPSAA